MTVRDLVLPPLPKERQCNRRGGPDLATIKLRVEVVTQILGGAPLSREIDDVDVIRVPSIRGQLRFWWRALNAHRSNTSNDMFVAESAIWGRAADKNGGRSEVTLSINVIKAGERDDGTVDPRASGFYVLWPAKERKEDRKNNTQAEPVAPRRKPGTTFEMTFTCPQEQENHVREAVRAWLLFGGYGSRTRRGLGGLTAAERDREAWLPQIMEPKGVRSEFERIFGRDIFAASEVPPNDTPRLSGAKLWVGPRCKYAEEAWIQAVDWLQAFRKVRRQRERPIRPASPLIIKALAFADGEYAPCALWLERLPANLNAAVASRDAFAEFAKSPQEYYNQAKSTADASAKKTGKKSSLPELRLAEMFVVVQ